MTEFMFFDECFCVGVSLEGLLFVHCSYITMIYEFMRKVSYHVARFYRNLWSMPCLCYFYSG